MPSMKAFVTRHAVWTYYMLTFAISWGSFLLVGGQGFFAGTDWQSDTRFVPAILAMLTGPSISGLLLIGLLEGKAGYRELLGRLFRWRVGTRWYAVALLTTPVVMAVMLFVFSRTSPVYLPAIVTSGDTATLVLIGLLASPFLALPEELGWTGFAIPRLRKRYGWLSVGLIVGLLWGPWHLLQIVWVSRTMAGTLPQILFFPLYFLAPTLLAYRVLMVWVYDRAESVLVAVLMHGSYIASTLFIFETPAKAVWFLISLWTFAAALCALAAAVVRANRRQLSRQPAVTTLPGTGDPQAVKLGRRIEHPMS